MAGKVIGKVLPFGFRGSVTRTPDTIIAPYVNSGEEKIQFGEPVAYDANSKGVRKIKSTDTAASIVGIAVRRIGQPYADNEQGWYYASGDSVDVLLRGSIAVELEATTGIAGRGKVYYNPATGEVTSVASHTEGSGDDAKTVNHLEVPNTVFTIGECDSENIAEVTILTRSM